MNEEKEGRDDMKSRKSFREKLKKDDLPKIVDIPSKIEKKFGKGKMLIPNPENIEKLIRGVKEGELITITQIREKLARDFSVGVTCPLTTGIFIRLIAEAAEEERKAGKEDITPYWRVIRDDGSLNEKFPGGAERQKVYLEKEGHTIVKKGKKLKVLDFEKFLVRF